MFNPITDKIDQLIRFAEALAKLEPEERVVFIEAFDKISNPPLLLDTKDFMEART